MCSLVACSSLIGSVTQGFADDLSTAILDNEDLEMVRDGAPSYLILIDSLVARSPENSAMLRQSALLHSAYAGAFVEDEVRSKRLNSKAKDQALESVCLSLRDSCGLDSRPFKEFAEWVGQRKKQDVPDLFMLGGTWSGWIQANSEDFSAIADLARVKLLMNRVAELQPDYELGQAFVYLGVFETLLPPAMGGKPQLGREYFEKAISMSDGQHLLSKVLFAEQYARLVFDRDLHDRLLNEVMASPVRVTGLTLMNVVAQEQAKQLLETADEYF